MKPSDNGPGREKKYRSRTAFAVYCLVSMSMGTTLARALLVGMNPLFPLVFAALVYLLIRGLALWKPALPILILSLVCSALLLYSLRPAAVLFLASGAKDVLLNVKEFLRGREPISAKNAFPLWFAISSLLCVFTFSEVVRFRRLLLYFPVYLLILAAYWYQAIAGTLSMIILLVAATLYFYGVEREFLRLEKDAVNRQRGRTAFFYSLVITLGALALPDFSVFLDAGRFVAGFEEAFPAASDLRRYFSSSRVARNPELFKFQETGFQPDDSVLGGPVVKNTDSVLKVVSAVPLYLRGNVKTFYINNNWVSETFVDSSVETNAAFNGSKVPESLFVIRIYSLRSSMRMAFSPYRTRRVDSERYKYIIYNEDDIITFPDAVYRDESYAVYASLFGDAKPPEGTVDLLVNPDRYLQLPRNLPGRVAALAGRICDGIENPYEKAAALRDFLRSEYEYSLEAPVAPADADFVDHFLFDLKRGYCTYFATALAIMLRTQGVPSRYVEGYLAQDREAPGSYLVRQDDAHAWVEAYCEGYGWTTLDATPGILPGLVNAGQDYLSGRRSGFPDSDGSLIASSGEELLNNIPETEGGNAVAGGAGEQQPYLWAGLRDKVILFILACLVSSLIALALRITALARREKRYWLRLGTEPDSMQLIGIYTNILAIMALLKEQVLVGETAYEFSRRIRSRLDNNEPAFLALTQNFVIARYSADPLPADAIGGGLDLLKKNDIRLRSSLGIFRYSWIRYVKGRIFSLR